MVVAARPQPVREHVVGDGVAGRDPLHLVEVPVDAQVDAALAVLLRRRAEALVGPRLQGAPRGVLVPVEAVALVRGEREGDVVAAVTSGTAKGVTWPQAGVRKPWRGCRGWGWWWPGLPIAW